MKIKRIEFENFRNFRDHGEIRCSTDGKMTVIYGKNGDGKTTLHQLFQWILYGEVSFNKTATARLYNLSMESKQPYGACFDVMGRIDFEHDGVNYSVTRRVTFKKGIADSSVIGQDFTLQRQNEDYDWLRIQFHEGVSQNVKVLRDGAELSYEEAISRTKKKTGRVSAQS